MDTLFSEPTLVFWSLLGTLVGTLILLAVALWASTQVTRQARDLWVAVRGRTPEVVGAVDEPTDPVIIRLGQLSSVPPAVWAAFLPAFVQALAAGLDAVLMPEE